MFSSHVARHVAAREAGGQLDKTASRPQLIDEFVPKVHEWVKHSRGKLRADKAHEKLLALGYQGSERTTGCARPEPGQEAAPRSANHSREVGTFVGHQRGHRVGH